MYFKLTDSLHTLQSGAPPQVLGSLPGRVSVDVGLHEKTRPTYLSRASGKPYLLSKKAVTNRYTHPTLTLPTYRQRQTGINGYPTRQGAEDLARQAAFRLLWFIHEVLKRA